MEEHKEHLIADFKNSFCNCIDFINCCNNTNNLKDTDSILDVINTILPFKTCSIFQVEIGNNNKVKDYKFINNRSEDSFWKNYTVSDFVKIDPNISLSIERSSPIKWKDTYATYRNKNNSKKIEELIKSIEECNLNDGVTFSVNKNNSPNIFIIFLLCVESFNYEDVIIHKLNVLLPYAYKPIHNLFSTNSINDSLSHNLTSREREVLKLVIQGKTSGETGKILSITERTVKFHLNNTYQKLNAKNRSQAIITAMNHGLI